MACCWVRLSIPIFLNCSYVNRKPAMQSVLSKLTLSPLYCAEHCVDPLALNRMRLAYIQRHHAGQKVSQPDLFFGSSPNGVGRLS